MEELIRRMSALLDGLTRHGGDPTTRGMGDLLMAMEDRVVSLRRNTVPALPCSEQAELVRSLWERA